MKEYWTCWSDVKSVGWLDFFHLRGEHKLRRWSYPEIKTKVKGKTTKTKNNNNKKHHNLDWFKVLYSQEKGVFKGSNFHLEEITKLRFWVLGLHQNKWRRTNTWNLSFVMSSREKLFHPYQPAWYQISPLTGCHSFFKNEPFICLKQFNIITTYMNFFPEEFFSVIKSTKILQITYKQTGNKLG